MTVKYFKTMTLILEKDLLKGLRTVIVIEYAKTMRQKKRREHGKQRRV